MTDFLDAMIERLKTSKTGPVAGTLREMREHQYGIPLPHFAQQHLFGATGIRIWCFVSIQGKAGVGKSTLLYDLAGLVAGSRDDAGLGGMSFIYDTEHKTDPRFQLSILLKHGERAVRACRVTFTNTLKECLEGFNAGVLKSYVEVCPDRSAPMLVGIDSIGGSGSEDTIKKVETEGAVGKGFTDKSHIVKHWCENQSSILDRYRVPAVVICINQEKDGIPAPGMTVAPKTITGGGSQGFKCGYMISVSAPSTKNDGKTLRLKTVKSSYSDPRMVEVDLRWDVHGNRDGGEDVDNARFKWALASARLLQTPDRLIGDLKSICEVSVSEKELVTCQQLGLRSVQPEEFEAALFSEEHADVLDQLYRFFKIERIRPVSEYPEHIAREREDLKSLDKALKKKKEEEYAAAEAALRAKAEKAYAKRAKDTSKAAALALPTPK
ncbi:MAG: hypothetical protein ACI4NA_05320, partial [Succinivibrio sp.]